VTDQAIRLFLVRHGEAAAHWGEDRDPGLSERGREQASIASNSLLELLDGEVRLVSSPLLRARQTAEPLASALGIDVEIDEAFREIPSPATLANRSQWIKQFRQQTWQAQPETLLAWREQANKRLLTFDGSTVIFTHFMILNAIVGRLRGCAETVCFQPEHASVTELQRAGATLRLIRLGREMHTIVN
jgi:broad specificity phosphatase PhoE